MGKELSEEEKASSGWTLAAILLCISAIWAASGWLLASNPERGTFGDMFGAVNALFSGCAFATLIYTVFLQRRELQYQREELMETRKELSRSASAQEASEAALRAQAEAAAQSANLAAVNALLTYYREELQPFRDSETLRVVHKEKLKKLKEREQALVSLLDITYHQVTTRQAKKDGEPSPVFPVALNPKDQS